MNDRGALGPVRLTGRHVALEPLRSEHLTGLLAAYSVLEDEWPAVKTRLLTRLDTDMLPRAVGDST